jgi:hypothetical protein
MKATYSPWHKQWIVPYPDRHELILAGASTKDEAERLAKERAKQFDIHI